MELRAVEKRSWRSSSRRWRSLSRALLVSVDWALRVMDFFKGERARCGEGLDVHLLCYFCSFSFLVVLSVDRLLVLLDQLCLKGNCSKIRGKGGVFFSNLLDSKLFISLDLDLSGLL